MIDTLPVGGSELFLLDLINRLDLSLFNPVLISMGSLKDPVYHRIHDDIPKFIHSRRWRYDLSPIRTIRNRIVEYQIDTIFCINLFTYFFVHFALRGVDKKIKTIISLHVTTPRSIKEAILVFIYSRLLSKTDEVVTICENQKRFWSKYYRIPVHQMTTIYNGIDTAYWSLPPVQFNRSAMREELKIPADAIVILNVSMIRKEKRHDLMVRALLKVRNRVDTRPIVLVFVGGGTDQMLAFVNKTVKDYHLQDRVILAGLQEDVRPYYWVSDIFTLPTTHGETLSLATLQALSTGLPCVLSDIGGANEMIQNGQNGILVSPGSVDALVKGWESCIHNLNSFQPAPIRQRIIDQFNINDCLRKYQERMLQSPLR